MKCECEQCFTEYEGHDGNFKVCNGDACHEEVCKDCYKPCKNPVCKRVVCTSCLEGQSAKYCGEYCITCAMWTTDPNTTWINFDFVAKGMTHAEGYIEVGRLNALLDQERKIQTSKDLKEKIGL